MKNRTTQTMLLWAVTRKLTAVWCAALLAIGQAVALSQAQQPTNSAQTEVTKIPADQLETLVAPIALYPDPLLAQTLAAKDKLLADAVAKQPWDPSVQALAGLPDVVKRLADDIQWTTDLAMRWRPSNSSRKWTSSTPTNPGARSSTTANNKRSA